MGYNIENTSDVWIAFHIKLFDTTLIMIAKLFDTNTGKATHWFFHFFGLVYTKVTKHGRRV